MVQNIFIHIDSPENFKYLAGLWFVNLKFKSRYTQNITLIVADQEAALNVPSLP